MTPLQRIAMGLVVVFGIAAFPAHPHPSWATYDALADPLGWLLVLWGVVPLVRHQESLRPSLWLGGVALAVSVPLWFPQLSHHLSASGAWATLLPQNAFCLLLTRGVASLGDLEDPRDGYVAKRFGVLFWGFAVLTALPVLVEGGGLSQLDGSAELVKILVSLAAVFYLFMVHRRTYLAGPGPRDWTRARETDETKQRD